jgi:hypothetical protein
MGNSFDHEKADLPSPHYIACIQLVTNIERLLILKDIGDSIPNTRIESPMSKVSIWVADKFAQ